MCLKNILLSKQYFKTGRTVIETGLLSLTPTCSIAFMAFRSLNSQPVSQEIMGTCSRDNKEITGILRILKISLTKVLDSVYNCNKKQFRELI